MSTPKNDTETRELIEAELNDIFDKFGKSIIFCKGRKKITLQLWFEMKVPARKDLTSQFAEVELESFDEAMSYLKGIKTALSHI